MKYMIIRAGIHTLPDMVEEALAHGWKLQGGVASNKGWLIQAMVRDDDEDTETEGEEGKTGYGLGPGWEHTVL